jgi:uncharacterized protein
MQYFRGSFFVTFVGLMGAAALGWSNSGTLAGVTTTIFIVLVLAILEISLSFDNAVVNATVLQEMDPIWRRRFITWGIAIAVFGMRIVFPLVIVAVLTGTGLWSALVLAATDPEGYSRVLTSAHVTVSAFGGAFLVMVGLRHFFDFEKEVHWLAVIERRLAQLGRIEAVEIGVVLLLMYGIIRWLPHEEQVEFLIAGMLGLITYIAVDGVAALLEPAQSASGDSTGHGGSRAGSQVVRSGAASFLYLEVLDASFSFDGVIGAFALSNNLFVIAIGLGIGAMFVRSLTIFLVSEGTLAQYLYLEHGAFWAIIALGAIMFLQTVIEVPEVVTGLVGAGFIASAFASSIKHNRQSQN